MNFKWLFDARLVKIQTNIFILFSIERKALNVGPMLVSKIIRSEAQKRSEIVDGCKK